MKKVAYYILLTLATLNAGEIKIAVAANVSYATESLIKEFNLLYPHTQVQVILGSSGKLTAQINHGAPYELFLSANMKYPQSLYDKGKAVDKPVVYAQGSLSFLSQKEREVCKEETVLNDEDIKKIAIGNPKTAPYGVATVEALKNAKLYKKHQKKFVYGESISQTVIYATNAADIGIVATSSLYSPKLSKYKEGIHWWEVNENLYTPISQGMVLLKENAEARAFYNFMLSDKAKAILKKYGYSMPLP